MYLNIIKSDVFKYLNSFHLPVMYLAFKYNSDQAMYLVFKYMSKYSCPSLHVTMESTKRLAERNSCPYIQSEGC